MLKYESWSRSPSLCRWRIRDDENSSGDMHSDSFHVVTKAFLTPDSADPGEQPLPLLSGVAAPEPRTVALRIRDQRPFRSIRSGRVSKTRPCVRHPSDGVETGCCDGRQEHHAHHRYVRLSSARPHDRKGGRAKNAALGFPLEPVHAVTAAGPGERLCRLLGRRAITIADAGAAGGIAKRWRPLAPALRIVAFEPDGRSDVPTSEAEVVLVRKAAAAFTGIATLYMTRKPRTSSLLRPNVELRKRYPDPERADVVGKLQVACTTIDAAFAELGIDGPDFIKIDTQGTELDVLKGAERALATCLALEVEVEFQPLYEGAALFRDIDAYVSGFGVRTLRSAPHVLQAGRKSADRTAEGSNDLRRCTLLPRLATSIRGSQSAAPPGGYPACIWLCGRGDRNHQGSRRARRGRSAGIGRYLRRSGLGGPARRKDIFTGSGFHLV